MLNQRKQDQQPANTSDRVESAHIFDQTNGMLNAAADAAPAEKRSGVNHNVTLGSGTGTNVGWAQYNRAAPLTED